MKSAPRRIGWFLPAAVLCGLGCSVYTLESLEPTPIAAPVGLLPLSIHPPAELGRGSGGDLLASQDFFTIFRREMETNVFAAGADHWGHAEARIVYDRLRVTGTGGALIGLQAVTLFVPSLLGAPVTEKERTMQAEIVLYDSRRVDVATYVVTANHRFKVGLYNDDVHRRAGIDTVKLLMEDFRTQLAGVVRDINRRLETVGPVN